MVLAVRWSHSCVALAAVFLFSSAWSGVKPGSPATLPDSSNALRPSAPDIEIESATIQLAEECRPSEPLFYISATIHNRGTGPAIMGQWKTVVYARDKYARNWGNGLQMPGLGEGERQLVTFPVYFLATAPQSMAGTHNFMIHVAVGGDVEESSYANNRFGPVTVRVPIARCLQSHRDESYTRPATPVQPAGR